MLTEKDIIKMSQRLKSLRESKGITSPERLSMLMKDKYDTEISGTQLRKYEMTDKFHSWFGTVDGMAIKTLYDLAEFYGIPADYVLGRIDTKEYNNTDINKELGLTDKTVESIKSLMTPQQSSLELLNLLIQRLIEITINSSLLDDITELKEINADIISSFKNSTVSASDLPFEKVFTYAKDYELDDNGELKGADIIDTPVIVSGHRYKDLLLLGISSMFIEIIKEITLCNDVDRLAKNYYKKNGEVNNGNNTQTK